jgi:lipopolysaccharide heptosyltransferase II
VTEVSARVISSLESGGRILVTRLQYLGDVVLSLPLVDALAERFPRLEIDYLCRSPVDELLRGDRRFSRVWSLDGSSLRLVRGLRARRFDAVIDLYSNPRSAWLSWLSGAPVRIGGNRRGRRHLYTHPITVPPQVRAATAFHMQYGRPLGVMGAAGKPVIEIGPDERASAREKLASLGVTPDRPAVGIHPGGKWVVKRWPVTSFADLSLALAERLGTQVVVLTGPGEEEHTAALADRLGTSACRVPALPVRQVTAVLSELDAVVVSDGGIMHLSAAVGTPTVGIFGSSEPDVWFPYESYGPYRAAWIGIECRPCHRHVCPYGHTDCLNRLHPEMVLDHVASVLEERGIERSRR